MKKIILVILLAGLTLSLTGCSSIVGMFRGGNIDLDRTVSFNNGLTFHVSSDWNQNNTGNANGESFTFTTQTGDIVAYSLDFAAVPVEEEDASISMMQNSSSYSNISLLPRVESSVDGANITVFEYSFTSLDTGDMSTKIAYVVSGNATVIFSYTAPTKDYKPEYFDAVIASVQWENVVAQSNNDSAGNIGNIGNTSGQDSTNSVSDQDIALLTSGVWKTQLSPGNYAAAIDGYLYIRSDGTLNWDFGTGYSEAGMGMVTHNGTWSVSASELSSYSGNTIKLSLTIDDQSWVDYLYYFPIIEGIYQFDVTADTLTLQLLNGDVLFHDETETGVKPIEQYVFQMDSLY